MILSQAPATKLLSGDERLPGKFWAKVEAREDGCWIWTAYLSQGYGRFHWEGKRCLAHRVAYQTLVGPIPEGRQIDHVVARGCLSRACVNPAHLDQRRAKTHCPHGHFYNWENPYVEDSTGVRRCQTCRTAQRAARRERIA